MSALASVTTGQGRTPPNPWHGVASAEEIRQIVGGHLDRLAGYLAAALAEQEDDKVRATLTEVQQAIVAYTRALGQP